MNCEFNDVSQLSSRTRQHNHPFWNEAFDVSSMTSNENYMPGNHVKNSYFLGGNVKFDNNATVTSCNFENIIHIIGDNVIYKSCKFLNKSQPIGKNLTFENCEFLGEFKNQQIPTPPPFNEYENFSASASSNLDFPLSDEESLKESSQSKSASITFKF